MKHTKNTVYPKEGEKQLKQTIKKLKAQVKRLEKENLQLQIDRRTLEKAFEKSVERLNDYLEHYSVEQLINMAKDKEHEYKSSKEKVREKHRKLNDERKKISKNRD